MIRRTLFHKQDEEEEVVEEEEEVVEEVVGLARTLARTLFGR